MESKDIKGMDAAKSPGEFQTTSGSEIMSAVDDDDRELEALGYVPSFKREFSNLATVRGGVLDDMMDSYCNVYSYPSRLASHSVSWY